MRRRRRGKRRSRVTDPAAPVAQNPALPSLGRQVDRIGRAAVSTTLVAVFADDEGRALALDAYNEVARLPANLQPRSERISLSMMGLTDNVAI